MQLFYVLVSDLLQHSALHLFFIEKCGYALQFLLLFSGQHNVSMVSLQHKLQYLVDTLKRLFLAGIAVGYHLYQVVLL